MPANQDTYNNAAWGRPASGPAWGPQGSAFGGSGAWGGARSFLDGLPRPVAIGLMVLAFALWWPVGLAALFYMIGSGRLGARWRRDRMQGGTPWGAWNTWASGGGRGGQGGSSGNHAFDEYREHTLKRLEDEQQEFASFLERLRFAKDKAEFDAFMADRRGRPPATGEGEQAQA